MSDLVAGLISPGSMGASVGAAVSSAGGVLWASQGRSSQTRERAERAGLVDAGDLATLVRRADVLLSVCPPQEAVGVAEAVGAHGFPGVYLDANAIAPATARAAAEAVGRTATFVDGSIIGFPVGEAGATRLYLAGHRAGTVADLFAGSPLDTIVLDGPPPAASALKMCFSGHTKGTTALLLAVRALAAAEGVEDALVGEWQRSNPDLVQRSESFGPHAATRAWRYAPEMQEIAASLGTAGLPQGFHQAAAELFGRLHGYRDAGDGVALADVLATLLGEAPRQRGD